MLCLLLVLPCIAAGAEPGIKIKLRPTATVSADSVYLGDIAEIQVDDPLKSEKLSAIRVENAPFAGESRRIHPNKVVIRLKQFGLDESAFQLNASGPVKVLRRYAVVAAASINDAVRAFILRNAPWQADQLKIEKMTFDDEVTVPPGKVSFLVTAPKHTDWLGPVPFLVQIRVDGKLVRKVTAPATLDVWSDVVVSAKPLGKFQPIEADDIAVQRMNLSKAPSNAIMRSEQVIGRRASRNIAPNCILRTDMVEMPPVVKRGDVVQIIAETSLLKIAAKGMAKQDGAVGDRIRVINLRSKRVIYAQVMDEQTVGVEF